HVDDLQLLGDLLGHQACFAAEVEDVLEVGRRLLVGGDDDRARPLPRRVVGQTDHGDVADAGVREQQVLDFLGADGLALADDDVLEPARDRDVAVGILEAEVAGAEPAVVVEGVGIEGRVHVPAEQHRALDADLTLLPRLRDGLIELDDLDLDAWRCAERYGRGNGGPAPASVTPSRCTTGVVGAGSAARMTTVLKPTITELTGQPIPPMCVSGNTNALTSPGSIARAFGMPYADAM